jgi:MoaA/NifB/PqqE/SkfB family radical SAM enzyme
MKKTEEELLKTHVCLQPFRHIELFKQNASLCCPSWLKKPLYYEKDEKGKYNYDVWNSPGAQEIRKSILDGSYKYCDKKLCPHLNTLIKTGKNTGMFARTDIPEIEEIKWKGEQQFHFPFCENNGIEIDNKIKVSKTPGAINFTFDDSCNFRCPSCRLGPIMANQKEAKEIDKIVNFINDNYSKDCRRIVITGSGDPFASKSFRKFLFEFDPEKWPSLKSVYLVSNGKLFNKQNWDKMKKIQPFISEVEISIDAGTKDTYENKTRLGGHWETLLKNLKFISTIKTIELLRISFVVQNDNYKEMATAVELIYDIFKKRIELDIEKDKTTFFFGRIAKWNHMTDFDIKEKDVANPSHPNYVDFIDNLRKAYQYKEKIHIQSNLEGLLESKVHFI